MKIFAMIPTYNEKENIVKLLAELMRIKNLYAVVVDDCSPDGTAEEVRKISRTNKRIKLVLRKGKKGRGLAGKEGFKYCLKNKADIIVEMDADFSHHPKYIMPMIRVLDSSDMVLGSRMIPGGKDNDRGIIRQVVTKFANLFIRIVLNIRVNDCNSGFRIYKRKVLEAIDVDSLHAGGPDIVQEVLFRVSRKGFRIAEFPIDFKDRKAGASKLSLPHLLKGYMMVLKLRFAGWKS